MTILQRRIDPEIQAGMLLSKFDLVDLSTSSAIDELNEKIDQVREQVLKKLKNYENLEAKISNAITAIRRFNYFMLTATALWILGLFVSLYSTNYLRIKENRDNCDEMDFSILNYGFTAQVGSVIIVVLTAILKICSLPKIMPEIWKELQILKYLVDRLDTMKAFIGKYKEIEDLKMRLTNACESKESDISGSSSSKARGTIQFHITISKCIQLYNQAFVDKDWKGNCYASLVSLHLKHLKKDSEEYKELEALMDPNKYSSLISHSHRYQSCLEFVKRVFKLKEKLPIPFIDTPFGRLDILPQCPEVRVPIE